MIRVFEYQVKWSAYLNETLDETLIEIGKTEKNLDIMQKIWFRPIFYSLYPVILHL